MIPMSLIEINVRLFPLCAVAFHEEKNHMQIFSNENDHVKVCCMYYCENVMQKQCFKA